MRKRVGHLAGISFSFKRVHQWIENLYLHDYVRGHNLLSSHNVLLLDTQQRARTPTAGEDVLIAHERNPRVERIDDANFVAGVETNLLNAVHETSYSCENERMWRHTVGGKII